MPTEPLDEPAAMARRLADLEAEVGRWTEHLSGVPALAVLAANLRGEVGQLKDRIRGLESGENAGPADSEAPYEPAQQLRWHELDDTGRAEALDRIRTWVETVYRPQFADGGRDLPPCWDRHLPCIVVLDALSEMHTGLYHGQKRSLGRVGMQLELLTRNAREAAAVLRLELAGCKMGHQERRPVPPVAGGGRR